MTSLRAVLSFNIKEQRHRLGISQAKLAERVNTSTHYIGMIESRKKFPSPEMLERIAIALEVDAPELFSTRTFPSAADGKMAKFQDRVINDITQVISSRVRELEYSLSDIDETMDVMKK